ncbi:ammonium transporter [Piscinibacter sakaiensis]|uniref:Diguanylate cyclase/phosphodiesterase with PAS/PAC sensor(S) n=1 Tax=Piscinibacter sakaiensis TaxID=1547922 RepID=A0A0K8P5T2_PISS1|nr:ammonium transporter [Piscinibacter sakaiensis]GAP38083.1 diguanylate cyclase/phosphodiesterase with PAS/PAC sensor(s) [Piscinibacter sakaiensis]
MPSALPSAVDQLWIVVCAALVFVMQAGFLCLESGLTRQKNSINVAVKNVADFAVATVAYWLVGFGLMFGAGSTGWFGEGLFGLAGEIPDDAGVQCFLLFQLMFCATATTIVSGAVAERMRFPVYLGVALLVSVAIYPVFGHWAWGGAWGLAAPGWLARLGFVDFAGSTVVHSVGGWVALVAVWRLGPREGRFVAGEPPRAIPASNLPLAMLGALLLAFGWLGFNGGSTLALDRRVPAVLVHTVLAAAAGCVTGMLLTRWRAGHWDVMGVINGLLAGLVAVTAGAHALHPLQALLVGAVGAGVMVAAEAALLRARLDDAVGAIPAHLAAGVWGTLAVGLFGDPALLGTGLGRLEQVGVQLLGIVACAAWCTGATLLVLRLWGPGAGLRIGMADERRGMNVAEHGARTDLVELLEAMEAQRQSGDLRRRVPEEPFTEVGQIAQAYNRVMAALERSTQQTLAILRDMRDGLVTFTREGLVTSLNPGAESLLGLAAADGLGQPLPEVLRRAGVAQPPDAQRLRSAAGPLELRLLRPGARRTWYELNVSEAVGADGEARYTATLRDTSERKQVEAELQRERDFAQVTLASIANGVITTDEAGMIQYINPVAATLTGWPAHQARGLPVTTVYRLVDAANQQELPHPVRAVLRHAQVMAHHEHALLRRRDGSSVPVHDTAAPIRSRDGFLIGAVLVFHDVTVTLNLARELSHQAAHDALTGVPNRREFERRLEELLAQTAAAPSAVCYLDLDQFKVVNDTCGHVAGDELLRQVTQLLRQGLRADDTLARLGGDEFGMILRNCPLDVAHQIAERAREAIADFRFAWEGKAFAIGVSIGIVQPTPGSDLGTLLAAADAACYAAKEGGRNRVHVYQPDDREVLSQRGQMQWVARLQAALDEDRLRLYVQPVVPLQAEAGTLPHHEILVRLEEDGQIVLPGAFLPAAERYGLMPRIDQWVVNNTLAWLGDRLRRDGRLDAVYAINLSGASLSDERFRQALRSTLEQQRLPPGALCFEITETAAVANLSKVVHFIEEVKALGCLFALDDFGSGLSSFAYLKNLPVDFLKIDGALVKDIAADPIDLAMVQAINSLGHVMGLRTIAEYVGSEAILTRLQDIGVDYGQGWHLGMPRPLEEDAQARRMPR